MGIEEFQSNGERDFPAPFLRRCLSLTMKVPDKKDLVKIISAHFEREIESKDANTLSEEALDKLVNKFIKDRDEGTLATDQLLNALFMVKRGNIDTKDDLLAKLQNDLGRVIEDE